MRKYVGKTMAKRTLGMAAAVCMAMSMLAVPVMAGETEAGTEAEAVIGPDTQKIIDSGKLRVGVKNAVKGFGFQDTITGEYSGMEISIAEDIAKDLGVEPEFTTVTAATRTELLDSGDIDCVLATFTITDERKKSNSGI